MEENKLEVIKDSFENDETVNVGTIKSYETEKQSHSVLGTAITGLIFTTTIVFTLVGFILSVISAVRGLMKKKKQKGIKIKGLTISVVSTFLSVIIMVSSIVVPMLFWEDIINIADHYGITDIIPVSLSGGQMELCSQIEKSLSVNEIDKAVSLSLQLEKPLSLEEKNTVMNALTQRINNRMRNFTKSFGSTNSLISDEILNEIEKYQKIINNVGISSSDNTNVDDYLSQVSNLKKYSKYNDYWIYYYATTDDWNSANRYWEYACDSYSDYMKNQHLSKALNHFNTCLSRTYDYSSSSFGISEARDFLQIYIDKINYYYNTGNDMSIDYTIVSRYENATDEFIRETKDFVNKIESLPTSVYYN